MDFTPKAARRFGLRASAGCVSALLAIATAVSPVQAKFIPDIEAQPRELREVLERASARLFDTDVTNDGAAIVELDSQLAKLREPSAARGVVQLLRAMALREDPARAVAAVEESVVLLPDYSGPLFIGSSIFAYTDQAAKAADYLLGAARIDPQLLARIAEYDVSNLVVRLAAQGERARLARLSERLLEVGWVGERVGTRSLLAAAAVEGLAASGETQRARQLITQIVVPRQARKLLIDKRYEALWPDIQRWAGDKLEKIWPLYLRQVRARWETQRSDVAALEYFEALSTAAHDATILWEIAPLLSGPIDAKKNPQFVFLVSQVARVLARQGRWTEVDALFERADKAWPLGSDANALNISANRARYLAYAGRMPEALRLMDATLADATKRGGEVNRDALAGMHVARACMLSELGRVGEAASSFELVQKQGTPMQVAAVNLCFDRQDAAIAVLLRGLDRPEWRGSILLFAQPEDEEAIPTEFARKERGRDDRLRSDPRLLERIQQYGRVLPWRLKDGAPAEGPQNNQPDDETT